MPAISVNIITKSQVDGTLAAIQSCLDNLLREGDEVVVLDTGSTIEEFDELGKRIADLVTPVTFQVVRDTLYTIDYRPLIEKWLPEEIGKLEKDGQYKDCRGLRSFAEARDAAVRLSKNPVIFWLDSDDVLIDKSMGGLRQVVDEHMASPEDAKVDAVFLNYNYARDDAGQVTTVLKRERFFFKDRYRWVGRCHETAIPKPNTPNLRSVGFWENLPASVDHTHARKTGGISDIRNYVILRKEIEDLPEGEETDPRTLFYLGNACRGMGRFKEAIDLYRRFDSISGSRDDRYSASLYIAQMYLTPAMRRPLEASDYFQKCVEIKPEDPRGYFGLSRCYAGLKRWNEVIHWYKVGLTLPEPSECLHSYNPQDVSFTPHLIAVQAYKELNDVEGTAAAARKALEACPNSKLAHDTVRMVDAWANQQRLSKSVLEVAAAAPSQPEAQLLAQEIVNSIRVQPEALEKAGLARIELPRATECPRVAIVCGATPEEWGPENEFKGIGGSEKMVILLGRALVRRGFDVTVYGSVPQWQRGKDKHGLHWQHLASFDTKLPRQAVIYWRGHGLVQRFTCPAKKRIMWFHDVQNPKQYSRELLLAIDHFNYQSKYHLDPVKTVVKDKAWIGRNAIDAKLFDPSEKEEFTVAYCSSPDRGLLTVLMAVKSLQDEGIPVKLEIAYGFTDFYRMCAAINGHRHIPDLGRDGSLDEYERAINKVIDATGAVMHHRVGFEECAKILNRSRALVYPTRFPEISCMSAMEAQAAGAVVISNRYGALDETIHPTIYCPAKLNHTLDNETVLSVAASIKQVLTDPDPAAVIELSQWAKERFDIEPLADEWARMLRS